MEIKFIYIVINLINSNRKLSQIYLDVLMISSLFINKTKLDYFNQILA
jgi:hypothetical protein